MESTTKIPKNRSKNFALLTTVQCKELQPANTSSMMNTDFSWKIFQFKKKIIGILTDVALAMSSMKAAVSGRQFQDIRKFTEKYLLVHQENLYAKKIEFDKCHRIIN